MRETTRSQNPAKQTKKETIVSEAIGIIKEFKAIGITLPLRQIWYKLVARHILSNTRSNYKYVSKTLTEARIKRTIPYRDINDPERLTSISFFEEKNYKKHIQETFDFFPRILNLFNYHIWENQPNYVEVWIEKNSLFDQFSEITKKREVSLVTCKGYSSITNIHRGAERIKNEASSRNAENIIILYFGDHDPSGKDISRNIEDRLTNVFNINVELIFVALTKEQIDFYDVPPDRTKKSDTRSKKFIEKYGDEAAELEALDPLVLRTMINNTISNYYDKSIFQEIQKKEKEVLEKIKAKSEEINLSKKLQKISDFFIKEV